MLIWEAQLETATDVTAVAGAMVGDILLVLSFFSSLWQVYIIIVFFSNLSTALAQVYQILINMWGLTVQQKMSYTTIQNYANPLPFNGLSRISACYWMLHVQCPV